MRIPLLAAVTLIILAAAGAASAEDAPPLREGDNVILQMSGDVAGQYVRSMRGSAPSADVGLRISLTAEIAQRLPNGRLRIETSQPIKKKDVSERLITISALVDLKHVETKTTSKGTQVYATPADRQAGVKPKLTDRDSTHAIVSLADMKGVTIRTWVLEETIAK